MIEGNFQLQVNDIWALKTAEESSKNQDPLAQPVWPTQGVPDGRNWTYSMSDLYDNLPRYLADPNMTWVIDNADSETPLYKGINFCNVWDDPFLPQSETSEEAKHVE